MTLLSLLLALVFVSAVSLIYTTTRLGIPPMPSNRMMRNSIVEMAREHDGSRIVDLGAGWGGLARRLALAFPDRRVEAVERSPVPLAVAALVAAVLGPRNLRLRYGRIEREPIAADTLYVCYLSPAGMERVKQAIERSRPERLQLISAVFALPGCAAAETRSCADLLGSVIYRYRL